MNMFGFRTSGDQLEKGRDKFIHTVGAVGKVGWSFTRGEHHHKIQLHNDVNATIKYKIQQLFVKVEWRSRGEHPYTGVFKVSQGF